MITLEEAVVVFAFELYYLFAGNQVSSTYCIEVLVFVGIIHINALYFGMKVLRGVLHITLILFVNAA